MHASVRLEVVVHPKSERTTTTSRSGQIRLEVVAYALWRKKRITHKMTKRDVLEGNRDLIKEACKQPYKIAREYA